MMWRHHHRKLAFTLLLLIVGFVLALRFGTLKEAGLIDWLDVLAEGSALLVVCGWLCLIVSSRPAGRVTEWLYYGSLLLVFSYFLNLLDEFLRYAPGMRLLSWLESFPAPVGMIVLTIGLIGWHREQRAIDRQLRGRELFLRDHQLIDPLTQLYGNEYLHAVLNREISLQQQSHKPLALLVVNIRQFSYFNRTHGVAAGDTLLCWLAEWLSSQLRPTDLLCRAEGDCFVALLPDTALPAAELIAAHIQRQLLRQESPEAQPELRVLAMAVTSHNAVDALLAARRALENTKAVAGQWQPA